MSARKPRRRWWIWLPLLALAMWLAVFGDKTPVTQVDRRGIAQPPISPPAPPPPPRSIPTTPTGAAKLVAPTGLAPLHPLMARDRLILASLAKDPPRRDLFVSRSWSPPLPPTRVPPPAVAVTPRAPALPFVFIGKTFDGSTWEVYVAQGEKSHVLREGGLIDNTYRVDKIAPPLLSVTYLPLGQAQTLAIGESR